MSTKNDKIFQESIQLAICLLEGGNTEIQVPPTLTPAAKNNLQSTLMWLKAQ